MKKQWYYGPHPTLKDTFTLTYVSKPPTRASHGNCMKFACGPLASKQKAINDARFCFSRVFHFVNEFSLPIPIDD